MLHLPLIVFFFFWYLTLVPFFSTFVLNSLEEKLSVLEDENHVLRQKALSATPRSNRPNFVRALSEVRHFVNTHEQSRTKIVYLWTIQLFIW